MKKTKSKQPGSQPAADRPLARADLRAISEEITREFPLTGEQSGVVLMDVDPRRLHAYWNLGSETLQRAQADFATAGQKTHLVLRFRELPEPELDAHRSGTLPLEVFDRELRDARGRVEVEVREGGGRYQAELGLTADDGGWKSLARSNSVQMPPAGPSPEPGMATLNVAAVQPSADTAEEGGSPLAANADERLPMADDPSLRSGPPEVLEPEFPNPAPLEQVPAVQPSAVQRVEPVVPPAPNAYFEALGFPDLTATARRHSSAVLSSSNLGELEIHVELHIHGRAKPGRELFLFGKRIPMAPDGTFDVRRVLDPESLLLPLPG